MRKLYQLLTETYNRIEPHHNTWLLWLKKKSKEEVFEVAIGTILVQNTNWNNVDLAISNLFRNNLKSFKQLIAMETEQLEDLIRPAGFYKQKAKSLLSLAQLFTEIPSQGSFIPTRGELLQIKGVGKETADSILVYCFYEPIPIVGTYTRRFFARIYSEIGYLKKRYESIQETILNSLPSDYYTLGKFHALIVSHSQQVCNKTNPLCEKCILKSICSYGNSHELDTELMGIQEAIINPRSRKKK